ncbi:type I restriction-modification system subunit M [Coleofasciculus sp. E2-BRE-01]|uniref:type I restriction-modification system subunit M n=1 Tax=Coleofasciculus sp. E2-BRE-01 TaxID=3069524 RepID=UPI00330347AB
MTTTVQTANHQELVGLIWSIADKLRGPYRPPQYRQVMLPMIVLRRLDSVLEPTKEAVLAAKTKYEKVLTGEAFEKAIAKVAIGENRKQPLYNLSEFTFKKLLGDSEGLADNLRAYINGFSPLARDIFDKFDFDKQIQKLDEANRLYEVMQAIASPDVDLSPAHLSNLQMGYLFEELVRKFNEQANEEAGDHFTPREVIRLMVNLVFCEEEVVFKKGIYRTVYDPTAGTGGMLSVAEEYIKRQNPDANLALFGQEYNPESYAICCSDLLIKDEPINNLVYGDTLGLKDAKQKSNNFVPHDGHSDKQFHYMFANPPFGVEWKPEKDFIESEYQTLGFKGHFGAGLPRINDGSLLFLQHMISKMYPAPEAKGDGSRIAIVFNGSPLFTGDARLNFQVSEERLARLWEQTAFQNLATSKKRKDEKAKQLEIEMGQDLQKEIIAALYCLDGNKVYLSREGFVKDMEKVLKQAGLKLKSPVKKAILAALGETDPEAEICQDSKGNVEPDTSLRDTEIVPLPEDIPLPLPLEYDRKTGLDGLNKLVKVHCLAYLEAVVLPHVTDAWIDFDKTKVGYEIPLNRHFYVYQPPRPLAAIEEDIKSLEADIMAMLGEVV